MVSGFINRQDASPVLPRMCTRPMSKIGIQKQLVLIYCSHIFGHIECFQVGLSLEKTGEEKGERRYT